MKSEHGLDLPRRLQIEFSKSIQAIAEDSGTEIEPKFMWDSFSKNYLDENFPIQILDTEVNSHKGTTKIVTTI